MLEEILDRLDKVRKSGNNYTACCPVHGDKSPSMSITEKEGKVLAHCHSCGANGRDVVEAIGLPIDVLFSEALERTHDPHYMLRKTQDSDDFYIMLAKASIERGERIKYNDQKNLRAVLARRDARKRKGIDQVDNSDWSPFNEQPFDITA
jgi:transcription elongation factor Elf1